MLDCRGKRRFFRNQCGALRRGDRRQLQPSRHPVFSAVDLRLRDSGGRYLYRVGRRGSRADLGAPRARFWSPRATKSSLPKVPTLKSAHSQKCPLSKVPGTPRRAAARPILVALGRLNRHSRKCLARLGAGTPRKVGRPRFSVAPGATKLPFSKVPTLKRPGTPVAPPRPILVAPLPKVPWHPSRPVSAWHPS